MPLSIEVTISGSPIHLSTMHSHLSSLPLTSLQGHRGRGAPSPSQCYYLFPCSRHRTHDKVALYWLKSRLARRLNSAHLIGVEPGQLVPTGQTPREMTGAVARSPPRSR